MDGQASIGIAVALTFLIVVLLLVARRSRRARRAAELPPPQPHAQPNLRTVRVVPAPPEAQVGDAPGADAKAPSTPRQQPVRWRSRTQHPIVLAHGWGGFDGLLPEQLGYSYFRGIPDTLRALGHAVHVAQVPPTASIELRAKQLAHQIKRLDGRVNIIAHSMGGLDARLAIARYGLDQRVASLTTIGTPHHGTPLADFAAVLGEWRRSRRLLGQLGLNVDGVYDVSTERMREFNRQVQDVPDVLYTNIVAAADPEAGGVHAMLLYGHRYLSRMVGPNDGIVPSRSQLWGETLEEIDADHWAQIGWSARFDVHGLYARIAQRLAARDL
jgi:triacylglycerol lipase